MKKTRMKWAALSLALVLTLGLAACGGGEEESPYAGTYTCVSAQAMGLTMTGESLAEFGFDTIAVTLKSGGSGTVEFDGDSDSLTWTLDEQTGALTLDIDGETLEGTLKDDTIVFADFVGMGVEMTLAKDGAQPAAAE